MTSKRDKNVSKFDSNLFGNPVMVSKWGSGQLSSYNWLLEFLQFAGKKSRDQFEEKLSAPSFVATFLAPTPSTSEWTSGKIPRHFGSSQFKPKVLLSFFHGRWWYPCVLTLMAHISDCSTYYKRLPGALTTQLLMTLLIWL